MAFFNKKEAAKYLGVSYITFLKYIKKGKIAPDYLRMGQEIFSKKLLDEFKLGPIKKDPS